MCSAGDALQCGWSLPEPKDDCPVLKINKIMLCLYNTVTMYLSMILKNKKKQTIPIYYLSCFKIITGYWLIGLLAFLGYQRNSSHFDQRFSPAKQDFVVYRWFHKGEEWSFYC